MVFSVISIRILKPFFLPLQVQLQLLTGIVKLFLKRPTDTQELVQQVLSLATQDSDNPDLRDRGYIYWRLLSTDPAAAKVLCCSSVLHLLTCYDTSSLTICSVFLSSYFYHQSLLNSDLISSQVMPIFLSCFLFVVVILPFSSFLLSVLSSFLSF